MNKEKIRKEFYRKIRATLRTETNAKNKVITFNTLAKPVGAYSSKIINWTLTEIKKMDTKVRKLTTCHRMHHPRANIECFYVRREN